MEHYAWLEKQATAFNMVVVAGDLVERFHSDSPLPSQKRLILSSLRRTAQKCQWLVICSGNNDVNFNGEGRWLSELRDLPNCILDNQSYVIEGKKDILVTCCPWVEPGYIIGELQLDRLFKEAETLRGTPPVLWLVVHHCPPGFAGNFCLR
jgi:DNA repair exonuclease SbcCD nuclease subunit